MRGVINILILYHFKMFQFIDYRYLVRSETLCWEAFIHNQYLVSVFFLFGEGLRHYIVYGLGAGGRKVEWDNLEFWGEA